MKDQEFMGNLAKKSSAKVFRASPIGVSLMEETNNQVGGSPADKFAGSKFEQPTGWPEGRRTGSPQHS